MTRGIYKCRIIKRDRDILYSIIRTALESINITINKTQSMEINSMKIKSRSKFSDFGELEYLDIYDNKIVAVLSSTSVASSCDHFLLIPTAGIDEGYVCSNSNKLELIVKILKVIANNYPDSVDIKCERC